MRQRIISQDKHGDIIPMLNKYISKILENSSK